MTRFRPPAVAGTFYPADPPELASEVDRLLEEAPVHRADASHGRLMAMIAPHAGYAYSGPTAACAYRLVRGSRFEAAVVVSPSHREYFDGVSVYDGPGYRTPLGDVTVDEALRRGLVAADPLITASRRGHGAEHAVEVHLPFLQRTLGGIPFLPVVMGDQRADYALRVGRALAAAVGTRSVLLIASSDLSHYHDARTAERLDGVFIADVAACDPALLLEHLDAGSAEACGGGPSAAVMAATMALGAGRAAILHHCTSGDVTGDHVSVVGYLAAAFFPPRAR